MGELPSFARRFFGADETFTSIGGGEIGGKAAGLKRAREALIDRPPSLRYETLAIDVPTLTVIGSASVSHQIAINKVTPAAADTRCPCSPWRESGVSSTSCWGRLAALPSTTLPLTSRRSLARKATAATLPRLDSKELSSASPLSTAA